MTATTSAYLAADGDLAGAAAPAVLTSADRPRR
jgi:hypothetical protein